MLDLAAGGRRLVCDWAGGLARSGDDGGTRPRFSGDQPRQAAEDEVEDRLIGRAGRQMDLDLGFHLDDAGGDLDEAQPQRVELRDPPGRGPGHQGAQAPQQPIGAGVQEQPELVGGGLGTRGAVGGEVGFPSLNVIFRLAAPAVEVLVEGTAAAVAEGGDDEAGIGAVAAGLDAGDDAADPAPGVCGVEELLEAADLASARINPEPGQGARLHSADVTLPCAGPGEAEHVVDPVRLTPVEYFRASVVAVGADQDLHIRPVGADRPQQATEKGADLDALRPLRRAKDGGDETAVLVEDDDRLEAVLVVMGVEQAQLLAAVDRMEGVVNVEGDPPRHLAKRPAIEIDQSTAEAQQRAYIR